MLIKFLKLLDVFLPTELAQVIDAPLLYRGRIIVATDIVTLITMIIVCSSSFIFNLSAVIQFGSLFYILSLIFHLYYLKNAGSKFEEKIFRGTAALMFLMMGLIFVTSFIPNGMGFFELIWVIPIFLMITFFFDTRFSFYYGIINFLFLLLVCYFNYDRFFEPIKALPHFSTIYILFLALTVGLSYLMAFLFVHLTEELQREVLKQRNLLVESAKFQSLGQMASNLAHDINNPLFSIQGKLHQIRNLLSRDQLDLEKCDQIVEGAEDTIIKLSQIVKGISTFAREGRGDQMISISIEELIKSNLALALDRIKKLGIKLQIQVDPKVHIICYPSFISQVLLNLLNNAIDAVENSSEKEIEVSAYREKDWIYIVVSDTGFGVPKAIEKKIFEPFYTTKTFGKGTGLGLSISKGLVELHEGQLIFERQGLKTKFIVKFPSHE